MRSNRTALIILLAILFLFFLQALSDFIQSIYAFGLLVTAFTPQLVAILLLFSPVALLFVRGVPSERVLATLGIIAVLGRLLEPLLDPGGRLAACGVSVGAFILLFALMMAGNASPHPYGDEIGWVAARGLLLAVMLSIFLRAAGSSLDVSEVGLTQVIAWALAGVAAWLGWRLRSEGQTGAAGQNAEYVGASAATPPRGVMPQTPGEPLSHAERRQASLRSLAQGMSVAETPGEQQPGNQGNQPVAPSLGANEMLHAGGTRRVTELCMGMAAVLVILYFAFTSPTVIARWTDYSYEAIVMVLVGAWFVAALADAVFELHERLGRPLLLAWNGLFVLMLVLTIAPHQMAFPTAPEMYPLNETTPSPLWQIPLYVMLLLSPVIFVDFAWLVRGLAEERPSVRQLGGGFALAALFVLVMVFLHVFTTIYDYAKPIGPLFRDRFWLVYLIAGAGLVGAMVTVGRDETAERQRPFASTGKRTVLSAAGVIVVLIGIALLMTRARLAQPSAGGAVRVMTYNIQQGFDKVGNAALPAQLEAIRRVDPDILGIEESDTARVANGNVDAVRYFADHLGMYSYYGPPTTAGTFGIALLSRYPIQRAWTFYMVSPGEQTACIQAVITANQKTYNVFVTHLGNDGPMGQLVDVLNRVGGLPNVILMGDFNFDPKTNQYAITTQTLSDAWLMRWPAGRQLTGGAEGRIDQIFISPDMVVSEAEYVPAPASDHPYLYAVVK